MKPFPLIAFLGVLFSVCAQAAVVTIVPGDNAQQKINSASAGDDIQVLGSFNSGPVTLKNGQKLRAIPGAGTLKFSTGGSFAVNLPGNARDITIDGVAFENNGGLIYAPSGMTDCKVTRCDLKFDGNGSNAVGVRSLGGNTRVAIDFNFFRDSKNSYRDTDLYGQTDVSFSYNDFKDCTYGSHPDGPKNGFLKIVGNTGVGWDQMGIEAQDHNASGGTGTVIFEDNVFYGWRTGTNNSFGVSVPVQNTGSLSVRNNYVALGDWDANGVYKEPPRRSGTHWGYGIEVGAGDAQGNSRTNVEGNIVIGSWVQGAVTCQPNALLKNNKFYGPMQWGAWGTEPGNHGGASWKDLGGNQGNLPIASAPKPPRRVTGKPWLRGTPSTQPTTQPTPQPAPFVLTISAITEHDCTITLTGATGAIVKFTNDTGAIDLGSVTLPGSSAVVTNLPKGWKLLATPIVNGVSGQAVAFRTLSAAGGGDWPWTGKVALKTTTPPVVVDLQITMKFVDGVPVSVSPATWPTGAKPRSITLDFGNGNVKVVQVP